jgi:hypothetical protein
MLMDDEDIDDPLGSTPVVNGISSADLVAIDQILMELSSQWGPHPWMITVSHDLEQVRLHIANSLPMPGLALDYLAHTIVRSDPVGTVAADLLVSGGTKPYTLTLTNNDNSNFSLSGLQILKNRASINQGLRLVTVELRDAAATVVVTNIQIQVLP